MKYVETLDIEVDAITVGERLREPAPERVAGLAASIKEDGQSQPIEVARDDTGRFVLIAGAHRLAAVQSLGRNTVWAAIFSTETDNPAREIALREIDENLVRVDLDPGERANFVARFEEIYEEMHPGTLGRGGDRKSEDFRGKNKIEASPFDLEVARKTGLGTGVINRALRIGRMLRALDKESRHLIANSPLAKKEGELYALTRQEPEMRGKIVEVWLANGGDKTPSVTQIANELKGQAVRPKPKHELDTEQLIERFKRAEKRGKAGFLEFLVEIGVIAAFEASHL